MRLLKVLKTVFNAMLMINVKNSFRENFMENAHANNNIMMILIPIYAKNALIIGIN